MVEIRDQYHQYRHGETDPLRIVTLASPAAMQARKAAATKRGPHRRKIALACEPCREKKTRCDGGKPICGPCERRSYALERCVYKAENARSASTDE